MMKDITIYQCNVNKGYTFMDYDFAKQHGFDINDYDKVASFYMRSNDDDDMKLLNDLWEKGNNGELQERYPMRSISVSDVIKINKKLYYVEPFGFKQI